MAKHQVNKDRPPESLRELGSYGLEMTFARQARGGWRGLPDDEFLYQLRGPAFFRSMREMSENDPIVGAALYGFETLLRSADWSVEDGDDPRANAFLRTVLGDMSHSWDEFISEWVGSVPVYGSGPFEVVLAGC